MKRTSLRLAPLVLAGGAALWFACGDDAAPPAAVAAKPTVAASTAPTAIQVDGGSGAAQAYQYAYNPMGKRDPFRSADETKGPTSPEGELKCTEPLCQFDLESLALVAVVSGDANPLAMFEDSAGIGYLIHRNSRVGRQGGKVTQILRDCVVVTEYWQGPDGKSNPNPVKVCVKPDKALQPMPDLLNPGKSY